MGRRRVSLEPFAAMLPLGTLIVMAQVPKEPSSPAIVIAAAIVAWSILWAVWGLMNLLDEFIERR